MDLTQTSQATQVQQEQGLVEWANAFTARSWEEVNEIQNLGVKEAAKTMQLIMSNPTEREMIRMRQDAQNDWTTIVNSERMNERVRTLAELVNEKLLSVEEAAKKVNMTVKEFTSKAGL